MLLSLSALDTIDYLHKEGLIGFFLIDIGGSLYQIRDRHASNLFHFDLKMIIYKYKNVI